ncbi:MAG: hypothetical protein VW942_06020 [Aquiluna sp.]|jgi:uncharacterized membrane protein
MKFQAVIFGRHVVQTTAACVTAISRGDIAAMNLDHWLEALSVGSSVGLIAVILAFGKLKNLQANKWGVAAVAFFATVLAWFILKFSMFDGDWTQPLLTGVAAAVISIVLSSTTLGKFMETMEKAPSPKD